MKYSSVIFDWDGVLGMTLHLWFEGYRSELKNLDFNLSDEVIIRDFFYEHDKTAVKYPDIDWNIFINKVREYVFKHASSLKTYLGARDTLEKLQSNNITLTLVSSSTRKLVEEELKQTGLEKFFSVVIANEDVTRHKPYPDPFLSIINTAKLNPNTTIILGDSPHDITAARAVGIDSCLFLPPENIIFYDFEKLKKSNPTHIVENLKDFADLVINS